GPLKPPDPLPKSTQTLFAPITLPATISFLLSALRSPMARALGDCRPAIETGAAKVPSPLPSMIRSTSELLLETTASSFPSLLSSARSTHQGEPPTLILLAAGKFPAPSPSNTEIAAPVKSAVTRSILPSLFRSPDARDIGWLPEENCGGGPTEKFRVAPKPP